MVYQRHVPRAEGVKSWPLWIATGLPVFFILLDASSFDYWLYVAILAAFAGWGLTVVLVLSPWVCAGTWASIRAVQCLRRRAWWQAGINIILPIVVLSAGLHFLAFIHLCNDAGEIVYWLAERPSYVREIQATPAWRPRLLVFNRGGMIWASWGFVYDESDEVVRSPSAQSAEWKVRAQGTELCDGYYARPFPGHFAFSQHWYLASFPC